MNLTITKKAALLIFSVTLLPNMVNAGQPIQLAQAQTRQITSGELVRVKKLIRDMRNVRGSISMTGPSKFQHAPEIEKYKKRFGQFTTAIKKYNGFNAVEVKTAQSEYIALRTALSAEFKRAQGQQAELGDVQGTLRALEKNLFSKRAPKPLNVPFSLAQARAWVQASVDAKTLAKKSLTDLQRISSGASLEKSNRGTVQQGAAYDMQDINRLSRFANSTIGQVDQAQKQTMSSLKAQIDGLNNELDYYRKLDPANPSHRANAFLKEGAPERIMTFLDDKLKVVMSAAHFLAQFGQKPNARTQSIIDEIAQLKINYSKNLEIAAGAYKLPKPKISNAKMMAIAKQIIEKKKYGFGQHGPIVLTTKEIISREREESEEKFTDIDVSLSGDITLHGTKTTWTYKWQEFKFATPVKADNGKWHVWWIIARNYSSGGSRTPIGEWVAGKSSQGSIIRKENF